MKRNANVKLIQRVLAFLIAHYKTLEQQERWNYLVETLMRFISKFNSELFREDLRKVGTFLIGGGLVGLIVSADKVGKPEAFILFFVGLLMWIIGLYGGKSE